jgi:hypothetical protein
LTAATLKKIVEAYRFVDTQQKISRDVADQDARGQKTGACIFSSRRTARRR